MKAGIFAAAALLQVAAAQPHRHNHALAHAKRQVVVTDVSYATVTAAGPDVVVFVDAAGNPVTTSTVGAPAATSAAVVASALAPAPTPAVSSAPAASSTIVVSSTTAASEPSAAPSSAPPASSSTTAAAPPASSTAAAAPSSTAASSSDSSSSSSSGTWPSGSGLAGVGIVYSPYAADGSCKTQDDVNTDFEQVSTWGYGLVRLYGTDCEQMTTVGSAVQAAGMKLMAGVFALDDLDSELDIIVSAANGDWSWIDTVVIGNELVNDGTNTAAEVVAALTSARSTLTAAGYTGRVVTVDTVNAVLDNLELCQNSDYAAVNAHPFFDPDLLPEASGAWALATQASVAAACGKQALITETGMPWGGDCDGTMCPSYANQKIVLDSLESSFPDGGIILLSAYNDLWKANNAYTFDAEQNWGIYGDCPSASLKKA